MEVIEVAKRIEKKNEILEKGRNLLDGLGNDKALASACYDKDLAIVIMKLKNGKTLILEGEPIKNPPATITEKIAKGICWESKLSSEQADIAYKSAITKLDVLRSQLNALQSINKHLDLT